MLEAFAKRIGIGECQTFAFELVRRRLLFEPELQRLHFAEALVGFLLRLIFLRANARLCLIDCLKRIADLGGCAEEIDADPLDHNAQTVRCDPLRQALHSPARQFGAARQQDFIDGSGTHPFARHRLGFAAQNRIDAVAHRQIAFEFAIAFVDRIFKDELYVREVLVAR